LQKPYYLCTFPLKSLPPLYLPFPLASPSFFFLPSSILRAPTATRYVIHFIYGCTLCIHMLHRLVVVMYSGDVPYRMPLFVRLILFCGVYSFGSWFVYDSLILFFPGSFVRVRLERLLRCYVRCSRCSFVTRFVVR
jgi:hypothetical protein